MLFGCCRTSPPSRCHLHLRRTVVLFFGVTGRWQRADDGPCPRLRYPRSSDGIFQMSSFVWCFVSPGGRPRPCASQCRSAGPACLSSVELSFFVSEDCCTLSTSRRFFGNPGLFFAAVADSSVLYHWTPQQDPRALNRKRVVLWRAGIVVRDRRVHRTVWDLPWEEAFFLQRNKGLSQHLFQCCSLDI